MANPNIPQIALIVTRGPLPGKISAVQKAPAEWGRKEQPSERKDKGVKYGSR